MSWNFDDPPGGEGGTQAAAGTGSGPAFSAPSLGSPERAPMTRAPSFEWPEPAGGPATPMSGNADPWGYDVPDPNSGGGVALPPGKPPTLWIAAAAACASLALVGGLAAVFVLDRSLVLAAICWLLAGPVAVLVLGQFVRLDERQRARAFYEGDWARPASIAVGVAALLGVAVSAYVIADWVATR